jgi:hypothetical protein
MPKRQRWPFQAAYAASAGDLGGEAAGDGNLVESTRSPIVASAFVIRWRTGGLVDADPLSHLVDRALLAAPCGGWACFGKPESFRLSSISLITAANRINTFAGHGRLDAAHYH